MSRIALLHYKVGSTDGVSLEMAKWRTVLERMGHDAVLCGGDLGSEDGILIEQLGHYRDDARRLSRNALRKLTDYSDGASWKRELLDLATVIEERLIHAVKRHRIDLLIPNNIWSIGANLSAAVALTNVTRKTGIPAIGHHHDFYWETFRGTAPSCVEAKAILDVHLPPVAPNIGHVVINRFNQNEVRARRGADATVVPNVFDFDEAAWQEDAYNRDFRQSMGIGEDDIFVLQATRVVERKGIELAIDVVERLDQPDCRKALTQRGIYDGRSFTDHSRIVLVLAGYSEDPNETYLGRLRTKADRAGIELRCISDRVRAARQDVDGRQMYSLWDCYVFADLVSYPSLWEGWGNQLLEAVRARLPIVLFEYPVYCTDIGPCGFEAVSLGSETTGTDDLGLATIDPRVIDRAAEEVVELLTDTGARTRMVERNVDVAREHFSLDALQRHLETIVSPMLGGRPLGRSAR